MMIFWKKSSSFHVFKSTRFQHILWYKIAKKLPFYTCLQYLYEIEIFPNVFSKHFYRPVYHV